MPLIKIVNTGNISNIGKCLEAVHEFIFGKIRFKIYPGGISQNILEEKSPLLSWSRVRKGSLNWKYRFVGHLLL